MLRFILVKLVTHANHFLFVVQTQIAVQTAGPIIDGDFAMEYVRESECNHQSTVFFDANKQQLPGIQ